MNVKSKNSPITGNARSKIKPDQFIIGGTDNDGGKVKRIYLSSKKYAIFRTESAIRLDIDDDLEDLELYESRHHELGLNLAKVYSILPSNLKWSEPINKQIARAIAVNLSGRKDDAIEMLAHAELRIEKLKTIEGKLHYTLSSFGVILALIGILLYFRSTPETEIITYIEIALCGALGGMLSVATGYNSLEIDIDASWRTNCIIGSSRILISISAALFSYFAVKSGIIFSFIKEQNSDYGYYLVAMVAGFSEMLVPSIMNNLSEKNISPPTAEEKKAAETS